MPRIIDVELPNHGQPDRLPELPISIYHARLEATRTRMSKLGIDFLVVYGDREHFANLCYLTGFDPRFEEAILLLSVDGRSKLLVGNECMGYLPHADLGLSVERFQEFSLLGQARNDSREMKEILSEFGVREGSRVGCAGWKYFEPARFANARQMLEIPAYLVDMLRGLCGDASRVVNVTDMFMHPQTGLRVRCEAEQIAQFEFAASATSAGVVALLKSIQPGVREQDLERHFDAKGVTLSCHRMLSFGEKAKRGLASPGAGRAKNGDAYTTAFGLTGALTSRAGVIARGPEDLPAEIAELYPRFAANYFAVTTAWYETVRVGVAAADVYRAAESARNADLFEFALNPGHYLHLDEWVHSPFDPASDVILDSGMMLQMDIIPISRGAFCYTNAEDGIVLADAKLQADLQERCPDVWSRLVARREWIRNTLGIALHDTVFPMADTTGWFAPYALETGKVFVNGL